MKPLNFTRVLYVQLRSVLPACENGVLWTIQRREMTSFLVQYTPPDWAGELKHIPKVKVKLANPDTPIHRWTLPGLPKHIQLSIKRDDMTGSTLSGNKVRKLEFLMADALQSGCGHVITCGGLQSNHCRAVAISARQLGLKPHLVLRSTVQTEDEIGCEGNVMLDRMCGAQLYMVPVKSPYLTELKPRMESLAQYLKKTTGEKSYHIPVGGSNGVGVFGYISVFEELISQGALEDFDDLVFACGSGGTAAGLSIANYLTGSKLRIHAISVCDNAEYFHGHCNEMLQEVGLTAVRSENILDVIDGYKGQGYGLSTQEEIGKTGKEIHGELGDVYGSSAPSYARVKFWVGEFKRGRTSLEDEARSGRPLDATDEEMYFVVSVGSSTGIMLDPVYTGKAARGLVKELQNNPDIFKGDRILFLHTGGVFGLMDGRMSETLQGHGVRANAVTFWQNKDTLPF